MTAAELQSKATDLGFPNAKLKVVIEFNKHNSSLAEKLGKSSRYTYKLTGIEKRGVLIGEVHKQLIEWKFVVDIY